MSNLDNQNDSSAADYRKKRKEKEAAELVSQTGDSVQATPPLARRGVKIAIVTVCLVLSISLLVYSFGLLAINTLGIAQRLVPVAKYGDVSVTASEANYYYNILYTQIYQYSNQYEQYYASSYGEGMGLYYTGYDCKLSPDAQDYPQDGDGYDELGDSPKWDDYFRVNAPRRAALMQILANKAEENNITLSDEEISETVADIETLRTTANENDMSLKEYLSRYCGEGVNEKLYTQLKNRDKLAGKYLESYPETLESQITDEQVLEYYEKNYLSYDTASFRLFAFYYDEGADAVDSDKSLTSSSEASAQANEMLGKISDGASFDTLAYEYATENMKSRYEKADSTLLKGYSYNDLSGNSQEVADWVFNDQRAAGDKAVIIDEESLVYYVVYLVSPHTRDDSLPVDVRHILIKFTTTDEDGNSVELTDEIKKQAYDKITEVYNEWEDSDKTEDTFASLAETYSEDTGSSSKGGLYEGVYKGQMVVEFENWCFDSKRATGDYEIVETSYGYHLMYFSRVWDETLWQYEIRNTLSNEQYNTYLETLLDEVTGSEKANVKFRDYFANRTLLIISSQYNLDTATTSTTDVVGTSEIN